MTKCRLKLVEDAPAERTFGSHRFIARTRNPALASPARFEPTEKQAGDVVISTALPIAKPVTA